MNKYSVSIITLSEENTVHDAIFLMQKNKIKRIVIVKKDIPVGVVTERDIGNFLESDKTTRSLDEIPIDEIMNRSLVTISSDQQDLFSQCAIRMDTFQISSVMIINGDGGLAGIVTKSDLVFDFATKYPGSYKVKDYMSKRIMTCRKTDSLNFVLDTLNKNKISRLVVTNNDGKPFGVITYDTYFRNSDYFENPRRDYLIPKDSWKGMTAGDIVGLKTGQVQDVDVLSPTTVEETVGPELIAVSSEDDLAKAANLMIKYNVSGIPVIDAYIDLKGVISSTDIVKAYTQVETHKRLVKKDPHFS